MPQVSQKYEVLLKGLVGESTALFDEGSQELPRPQTSEGGLEMEVAGRDPPGAQVEGGVIRYQTPTESGLVKIRIGFGEAVRGMRPHTINQRVNLTQVFTEDLLP